MISLTFYSLLKLVAFGILLPRKPQPTPSDVYDTVAIVTLSAKTYNAFAILLGIVKYMLPSAALLHLVARSDLRLLGDHQVSVRRKKGASLNRLLDSPWSP